MVDVGDVVRFRRFVSSTGDMTGKCVMSFNGESFGVILSVVRGFEGELIESPRLKDVTPSVSDLDRECEGVRLRWGRSA